MNKLGGMMMSKGLASLSGMVFDSVSNTVRWCLVFLAFGVAGLFLSGCERTPTVVDCETSGVGCPQNVISAVQAPILDTNALFGVSFTCVLLGCDETQTIRFENSGGGAVALSRMQIENSEAGEFLITLFRVDAPTGDESEDRVAVVFPSPEEPVLIRSDQRYELDIRYRPVDGMAEDTVLLIDWYDHREAFEEATILQASIPIRSRGLQDPVSYIEQTSINFGYVGVGEQSQRLLPVQNVTPEDAILSFQGLEVLSDGSGPFSLGETQPVPANPGSALDVPLVFAPVEEGFFEHRVSIRTDDPTSRTVPITLIGTSIAQGQIEWIEPSDAVLGFGALSKGESAERTIRLRNTGGTTLFLEWQINEAHPGSFENTDPEAPLVYVLAPTDFLEFDIRASALSEGPEQGTLLLLDENTRDVLAEIALDMVVDAPKLAMSATRFEFGENVQGWNLGAQRLTLTNEGSGPLEIFNIAPSGAGSSQVEINFTPGIVAPGASIEAWIRLDTSIVGTYDVEYNVLSNDASQVSASFVVSGVVTSCNSSCAAPNSVPYCSAGGCEIDRCVGNYFDLDGEWENGCECLRDNGGSDLPDRCSTVNPLDSIGDNCVSPSDRERFVGGNLHTLDDVDVFFIQARDEASWTCDVGHESFSLSVQLVQAPPFAKLCVEISDNGIGCNYGSLNSPKYVPQSVECGQTIYRHSGAKGADDTRDVTAWVLWDTEAPGFAPTCGDYRIKFKANR